MRRRDEVRARQADLEAAEGQLGAERENHRQAVAAREQATTQRAALAGDPLAFAENEQAIHDAELDCRRRELGVEGLEAEVEVAKRRLAHAAWAAMGRALEEAYAQRRAASGAVADWLAQGAKLLAALEQRRVAAQDAERRFVALAPDDLEQLEYPSNRDEPEWPVVDLLGIVAAGPLRPDATTAAADVKAERVARRREKNRIVEAVRPALLEGDFRRVESLDPHLRWQAVGAAEGFVQEELERRRALNAEAFQLATGGEQTEQIAAMLHRRLERVRELAEAVAA